MSFLNDGFRVSVNEINGLGKGSVFISTNAGVGEIILKKAL